MTIDEKIKQISDHYGFEAQSRQCIEEMADLTQAINKFWRYNQDLGQIAFEDATKDEKFDDIVGEMADVQVCLWHLAYLLNADYTEVCERKLDREIERIRKNDN